VLSVELLPVAPQPVAIRAMPAATAAIRNARIWRMVFLFSSKLISMADL
jgi:hypothetical protein